MDSGITWLETCVDAAADVRAIDRAVDRALDESGAEVIVNAIATTTHAEAGVLRAVNTEFPRRLASRAATHGARVVHVSTDGVFSGGRGDYRERDIPDPVDDYGRSKLAGELAAPHLTIRTSFFGRNPRGAGLVEWLVAQRGAIEGFEDYRFTGLSAMLLADLIADAIVAATPLEGVYHVGGDPVSKYELLNGIARQLQLDVQVTPVGRGAVDRTLDSSLFFAAMGRRRPTLADSLATLASCGVLSRV